MTPEQLNEFATYYYRQPRPELISTAIESLSRTIPKGRFWFFVGFFAEVFAANSDRVEEWQKLGKKQEWLTRDCLQAAAKYSSPGKLLAVEGPWIVRPGAILSLGDSWGSANDARWGAFFASGNPAYLRKFIAQLHDINSLSSDQVALGAMWSLARNAPDHPLIHTTLEAARADADPRTRALIDDLLTKNMEGISRELADLGSPGFPQYDYGRSPKTDGPRAAGDYGLVNQDVVGSRLPPDQLPKK